MSFAIRRTLAAREDLIAIWLSIARFDPDAADRHLDRIEHGIAGLADFPNSGVARDELLAGVRAILRKPYLVFYRVDESAHAIDIIRVIDARRDLSIIFRE